MKHIKINSIENPDRLNKIRTARKLYKISKPYENYNFYFKSKKEAVKFQINWAKELTKIMYEINYMSGELYFNYRMLWAYINDTKIEKLFFELENRYYYLFSNQKIHYVYINFNTIFDFIDKIINELSAVAVKQKQYQLKYHFKSVAGHFSDLQKKVFDYGKNSKYAVVNNPKKLT